MRHESLLASVLRFGRSDPVGGVAILVPGGFFFEEELPNSLTLLSHYRRYCLVLHSFRPYAYVPSCWPST